MTTLGEVQAQPTGRQPARIGPDSYHRRSQRALDVIRWYLAKFSDGAVDVDEVLGLLQAFWRAAIYLPPNARRIALKRLGDLTFRASNAIDDEAQR